MAGLTGSRRRPAATAASRTRTLEEPALAALAGGDLAYVLRRSARARRLRVTVDPIRGVVASVPVRTSDARARAIVEPFLADRERWLRRELARHEASRALFGDGSVVDGSVVPFLGSPHRLRIVGPAGAQPGPRERTRVERVGTGAGDELVIALAPGERRTPAAILESWFRARARAAILRAIDRHGPALRVSPVMVTVRDPRSRWGSASRTGRLMLAWRLVLAPPEVLETVVVHELCHLRVLSHGPRFWALVVSRIPDQARHRRWLRDHAAALYAALGERPVTPA